MKNDIERVRVTTHMHAYKYLNIPIAHKIWIISIILFSLRYFYGPIEGTQYTLAVAMPERYGLHEFVSQQEIRHSHVNGKGLQIIIIISTINLWIIFISQWRNILKVKTGKFIQILSIASIIAWKIWIRSLRALVSRSFVIERTLLTHRRSKWCTLCLVLEDLAGSGCRWVLKHFENLSTPF